MKQKLTLLVLILSLISCKITNEPEFKSIDNYKILKITNQEVKIGSDANFHNPNDVGCKVVTTNITVFVNDIEVGKVNQNKSIDLEANNDFKIPLVVQFPFSKISKDQKGLLNGLINVLISKDIKVKYKGFVTLKKAGISFDIDIEGEEKIKLKI